MINSGYEVFWPDGAPAEFFSSQDHLPGVVRKVLQGNHVTRVSIPDRGEVLIKPDENLAYTRVKDAQSFFQAPLSDFMVEKVRVHGVVPPDFYDRTISIRDLLWTAGFHASRGRLDVHAESEGDDGEFSVVHMSQWPNLTRVPHSPNTMRVCALLTRFPTSVALIPRLLEMGSEEVCQILSAARSAGILRSGHASSEGDGSDPEAAARAPASESKGTYKMMRSLLKKIHAM